MLRHDFPLSQRMLSGQSPIAGRKIHQKFRGGSLYHDDMIKKSPPENFAYVRSPPDFFLAFLLNIIIPRKSPPEEENALKNAPLKYAWRSQCPPEIEKAKKMPP